MGRKVSEISGFELELIEGKSYKAKATSLYGPFVLPSNVNGIPVTDLSECFSELKCTGYVDKDIEIDLSHVDMSECTTVEMMFCFMDKHVKKVKFGDMPASKITNMFCMFADSHVEYIDFGGICSSPIDMHRTFAGDNSLVEVKWGRLNFENVESAKEAFEGCCNIEKVDLHSARFSALRNIERIFSGCSKLKYVDLGVGKIESEICAYGAFFGCNELERVVLPDLASTIREDVFELFDTSKNLDTIISRSMKSKGSDNKRFWGNPHPLEALFHASVPSIMENLIVLDLRMFIAKKMSDFSLDSISAVREGNNVVFIVYSNIINDIGAIEMKAKSCGIEVENEAILIRKRLKMSGACGNVMLRCE